MDKIEVELTCPNCDAVFKQVLEQMNPGVVRQCPYCGADIEFLGDDGADVQKALDSLEEKWKNLFKE
jgi:uncharacterized C2H2 Zn-finger protein